MSWKAQAWLLASVAAALFNVQTAHPGGHAEQTVVDCGKLVERSRCTLYPSYCYWQQTMSATDPMSLPHCRSRSTCDTTAFMARGTLNVLDNTDVPTPATCHRAAGQH